jgi:hypothetical protein
MGSTRVPVAVIVPDPRWGQTCNEFLASVGAHKSKASSGYYLKTHLDYFSKLSSSIDRIVTVMRPGAKAILVVQDSYYKDVHNDLPTIVSEMAELVGLAFSVLRSFVLLTLCRALTPSGALRANVVAMSTKRRGQRYRHSGQAFRQNGAETPRTSARTLNDRGGSC